MRACKCLCVEVCVSCFHAHLSACVPGYVHSTGVHIHSSVHVNVYESVCVRWLESRLYGLEDYQGLCKCSMPVYSALFVGGIWRRQTAIDRTSQGEQ